MQYNIKYSNKITPPNNTLLYECQKATKKAPISSPRIRDR
jgi:hypothetical protein